MGVWIAMIFVDEKWFTKLIAFLFPLVAGFAWIAWMGVRFADRFDPQFGTAFRPDGPIGLAPEKSRKSLREAAAFGYFFYAVFGITCIIFAAAGVHTSAA